MYPTATGILVEKNATAGRSWCQNIESSTSFSAGKRMALQLSQRISPASNRRCSYRLHFRHCPPEQFPPLGAIRRRLTWTVQPSHEEAPGPAQPPSIRWDRGSGNCARVQARGRIASRLNRCTAGSQRRAQACGSVASVGVLGVERRHRETGTDPKRSVGLPESRCPT